MRASELTEGRELAGAPSTVDLLEGELGVLGDGGLR
jgi:hypothetical protein